MTAIAPPDRTLQQRMTALDRANHIRIERAHLKDEIRHGAVDAIPILNDPPEIMLTCKVIDLVVCIPKIGNVKARSILNRCHIGLAKTVGGLSDRQRGELVGVILQRRGRR